MTGLKVLTADEQVAAILAADARRVRRLTWLAAGLWGLVTLALAYSLVSTGSEVQNFREMHRINLVTHQQAMNEGRSLSQGEMDLFINQTTVHALTGIERGIMLTVTMVVLALTSLANVWLVHAVRRATLRQIQASLAAIAGQLAAVQRDRGTMPPTAGG